MGVVVIRSGCNAGSVANTPRFFVGRAHEIAEVGPGLGCGAYRPQTCGHEIKDHDRLSGVVYWCRRGQLWLRLRYASARF